MQAEDIGNHHAKIAFFLENPSCSGGKFLISEQPLCALPPTIFFEVSQKKFESYCHKTEDFAYLGQKQPKRMTTEEFKQQAETLRKHLLATAHKYLGETDEAEDIVQDAMIKLWLMHDDLRPPVGGIGSVITRNLCVDCLRRKKSAIDISQFAEEEETADNGEEIEQMMQIIDTLPSTQRTMLRMRHLEGMEMRDIATVLGSTETSVRQTLSRARKVVRRKMVVWLAAGCLAAGLIMAAGRWITTEREEECITIVYGKKYTDEQTVMLEMKRTMGEITEDHPQDEIENQLNELFGD